MHNMVAPADPVALHGHFCDGAVAALMHASTELQPSRLRQGWLEVSCCIVGLVDGRKRQRPRMNLAGPFSRADREIWSAVRGGDCGQALPLLCIRIEVGRVEPGFERAFAGGPLAVEHGEPGGVAVPVLDHHVLAEDAFEGETEAKRGAAAGVVCLVALPLVAAVAEVLEDVG